jgi:prepilin-type N-terminal cleavage/methylation domain-containing protein
MRIRFGHSSGYTLTEMMVVVGIISLMSALAVPNFLDWNRRARLSDAVSSLAWNLNLARMSAVNQNAAITVTVCHQTNPCPLVPAPGTPNPTQAQVTVFFQNPLGANVLPPMTMPTDIALTMANGTLVGAGLTSPQSLNFSPLGVKQDTANGNNLCLVANSGAYVGGPCGNNLTQAFNFRSLASPNYNYRIVVLPTGKISWCVDENCAAL